MPRTSSACTLRPGLCAGLPLLGRGKGLEAAEGREIAVASNLKRERVCKLYIFSAFVGEK